MNIRLLIALLLLHPAQSEAASSYRWVIENEAVIGCTEVKSSAPKKNKICEADLIPELFCTGKKEEIFSPNLQLCRKQNPTKIVWLKWQGTNLCAEMADYEEKGITKSALVRFVNENDCGHTWVELAEDCTFMKGGEYLFHPLSQFGLDDLIPEIMNMKENETVPPEVFAKHDSKKIALTLNYKLYLDQEKADADKIPKGTYDFLNDTEIQLAFQERTFDAILKNGFLNQHQIYDSGGNLEPNNRAYEENRQIGFKLEEKYEKWNYGANVNKVRPKYGYYGLQTGSLDDHPIQSRHGINKRYGNVFAVFNSDVKDRTTFTFDDSLDRMYGKEDMHTARFKTEKPLKKLERESEPTYVEAQIWGELGIKDVNHFLVNCEGWPKVSDATIAKLKSTGKPVQECLVDKAKPVIQEDPGYYDDKAIASWGGIKFVDSATGEKKIKFRESVIRIHGGSEF
ncbi:MAG: hypothetical protein ACXWQO_06460 [Bdellovibrionota bacterium]